MRSWLRSPRIWAAYLTLLAASAFLPSTAPAQSPSPDLSANASVSAADEVPAALRGHPLRVVVRVFPPFVMQGDNGQLQGFSIDLWNDIAARLKLKFDYHFGGTVDDVINQVATGKADVGISAISITAARDILIDFSQPMYQGGLQIAVRQGKAGSGSEFSAIWEVLTSSNMLNLIGLMLLTAVIIAHIVWLVERRHEEGGVVEHKKYIPGIFKAFWWSMGTIGSQVDQMPVTWIGRVIAIFWMFCAIIFVTYFTAAATTNLTVKTLNTSIQSADDLPGKRVATTTGSSADAYLQAHHAIVTDVTTVDACLKLLNDGSVDAVVTDAPVLQYYAANSANGQIQLVGDVFKKENYGIIVPNDSPLRIAIDTALLQMQSDGTYDTLVNTWFKPAGGN
jgi:polar amino acid transport system substrate-binding protein